MRRMALITLAWAAISASGNGCVFGGDKTWTAPQTETLKLDPAKLASLDVRTHNGAVEYTGSQGEPTVVATKKAAGKDAQDAEAALKSIQVFVESNDHGGQTVGWRWNTKIPPTSWEGEVAFAIKAPEKINLDLESHNGDINATGIVGEVKAVSHNGAVKVNSKGPKLKVDTHNGEIKVTYDGPRITLTTHNGAVNAELAKCETIGGNVESHNGAIVATIGAKTSADWDCRTTNGLVHFDPPATKISKADDHFKGRTGAGGTSIAMSTHNGEIHVKSGHE
ncbi:MAG: DUF4097 family beta strand repeat protein [Planctomycetes bacterium]|nr:DUF4097 family beta strand repeat protein [Planctomycetota bacterium]MBI3834797.1 DUF4097 family beta strand repeat protein [Planctomycetota bacterium]